jgi:hypothetical protein
MTEDQKTNFRARVLLSMAMRKKDKTICIKTDGPEFDRLIRKFNYDVDKLRRYEAEGRSS